MLVIESHQRAGTLQIVVKTGNRITGARISVRVSSVSETMRGYKILTGIVNFTALNSGKVITVFSYSQFRMRRRVLLFASLRGMR